MKLYHSTASPFVRKVMVLAHETGLADRLERVSAVVSPVARAASVVAHNPTGHIPTLVLDDGTALYDSGVICQYLDTLHDGPPLLPAGPLERARALCLQALGDGIMNAGVLVRFENALRPPELRWQAWLDGQTAKIQSSLDVLERDWLAYLEQPIDIGTVTVACALGYIDFRELCPGWRDTVPSLADWYARFAERRSMQQTQLRAIA
ncbi:glutathione S-transferase N-terminal domain-containing protein [Rhodopseudomonas sp. HC1]|uniref:glutathione S-transferase N-terminal domain-containing protein n=1 Tax=Rhodopseudomonas infernalis TaxID=2897386 RepID=UPI001EE790D4|nr:glutathione S-transferase N-terminal domain-containing protein [Rhodopseudomonas infernalis]MCG6204972.1 glutathione S-transferase N-terminal domain-containing protein [Rhodopseudomonas infernalis]